MKIFVINARRVKKRIINICCIMAFITVVSLLFSFVTKGMGNNEYSYATSDSVKRVIIIDPGHGGEDSGASAAGGALEKDLNLEISLLIGDELIKNGYTVVYTRTSDRLLYKEEENIKGMRKFYDLKNRCAFADEYQGAIFISIHMNNFGSAEYSGLQVYYSDNNEKSKSLASSIQESVRSTVQTNNNRKIKNGKGLYILDHCNATSVIVECGFLSNAEECEKLLEKEYQKELSVAIVCGIINYMDKT